MNLRERFNKPAFHISSLEVEEIVEFEIFVLTNEVSTLFAQAVLAYPSWYRFFPIQFDHRQKCKPEERSNHNPLSKENENFIAKVYSQTNSDANIKLNKILELGIITLYPSSALCTSCEISSKASSCDASGMKTLSNVKECFCPDYRHQHFVSTTPPIVKTTHQ